MNLYTKLVSSLVLTSLLLGSNSFQFSSASKSRAQTNKSALTEAISSNEEYPKPKLVSQAAFISARETVFREMAKAQGVEYVPQDDPSGPFAIGRLEVTLGLPPQIDLIETPDLVLVNGVSQEVLDQGMKPLDTIVSVSTTDGKLSEKIMASDLSCAITAIKAVMQHARDNGQDKMIFELNRLLRGKYL